MKHTFKMGLVLATILLVLSGNLFAQNTTPVPLTAPLRVDLSSAEKHPVLRRIVQAPTTLRHRLTGIDADALNADLISVELFDGKTVSFQRRRDAMDKTNGAWNGNAVGLMGSIVILPAPKGLYASIFAGNQVFEIGGIENGIHVLTEIDQTQYPKETCRNIVAEPKPSGAASANRSMDDPVECNIRLLIAYTPAAAAWVSGSGFGDMTTLAQAAVTRTNLSYTNSLINYRVELARVVPVSFTESGDFDPDLTLFRDNGDGVMDEVHGLRDLYRADVCVLITDGDGGCGLASVIMANDATAFCALNAGCAVGNLTFAHEIGHLQGARHDLYVDGSTSPFSYGHGLVYLPGQWRTVMSYNDECSDNGFNCTRLPYWSNPNVNNPDDGMSTGTTADQHNARVLNETSDEVRLFRTQAADLVLANTTLAGDIFADQTAANTIRAGTNYLINANADVRFRAGNFILLQPGFRAQSGTGVNSKFRATIENVANCPAASFAGENPEERAADPGVFGTVSLSIEPNLISDAGRIRFNLPLSGNVSLRMVNLLGENIDSPLNNQFLEQGEHTLDWQNIPAGSGLYYCILQANGTRVVKPFVVAR